MIRVLIHFSGDSCFKNARSISVRSTVASLEKTPDDLASIHPV